MLLVTFLFEAASASGEVSVSAADQLESVVVLLDALGKSSVVAANHADGAQLDN